MSNTYKIGGSTGQINLTATIATIGLAASQATVFVLKGTNPATVVATSEDATGAISQAVTSAAITAQSLKGQRLMVQTTIDFTDSAEADRQNDANAVQGKYVLSGGDDGTKTYTGPLNIAFTDPSADVYFVVDLQ